MLRRALIAAAFASLTSGQQAHAATAGNEFLAASSGAYLGRENRSPASVDNMTTRNWPRAQSKKSLF